MLESLRPVLRHLHHLPWVLAVAVLAFGIFSYRAGSPEAEKLAAMPDPDAPTYLFDNPDMRKAIDADEVFEPVQFAEFPGTDGAKPGESK